MFSKFGRITMVSGILLGALAFGASTSGVRAQTSAGQAQLRAVHASPDAPAVDIWVNGNKAISNLAFKAVTGWIALPEGSYDVKVTAAGSTEAVIEATLPLDAGKYYSVAAAGKLADITAKVYQDDLSSLEAGKARLRVIHASPDAPAVDVAVKGGAVLVPNLAFPNASDYLTVDTMTANVEVRAAGTSTVALEVPGLTLAAGKVYTVYAVGLLAGTPALGVLPVVDTLGGSGGSMDMPATGVGENLFAVTALALGLVALAGIVGGVAVRVRNR